MKRMLKGKNSDYYINNCLENLKDGECDIILLNVIDVLMIIIVEINVNTLFILL